MVLLTDDDEWTCGLRLGMPVEVKLLDDGLAAGTVEGYGAIFGTQDALGDTIQPGAFADSLRAHRTRGSSPAMLWAHKQAEPIGRWTGMGEDVRGLRVRGQLNLDTVAGRRAHAHLKAGDVDGMSIGFVVPRGGARVGAKGRSLSKVDLHEVSVVAIPAHHDSRVVQVKSLGSRGELEDLLRASGLARGAARKVARAGWPALSGEAPDDTPAPFLGDLVKALDRNLLDLKSLKGS